MFASCADRLPFRPLAALALEKGDSALPQQWKPEQPFTGRVLELVRSVPFAAEQAVRE